MIVFELMNSEIDKEEFKKVMELMRAQHRQGSQYRDSWVRSGLKVSTPVENDGLLEYFFGKDGKSRLPHEKFVQFLKDLHNEVRILFHLLKLVLNSDKFV